MSYIIYKYENFSYAFLSSKNDYNPESQEFILQMNRFVELCEALLVKMPLYVIIPGANPKMIAAKIHLENIGFPIPKDLTPGEKTWKLMVFSKSEEDCVCNIPCVKDENGIGQPDVPEKGIYVKFEDNCDDAYEMSLDCKIPENRQKYAADVLRTIPSEVQPIFVDMN